MFNVEIKSIGPGLHTLSINGTEIKSVKGVDIKVRKQNYTEVKICGLAMEDSYNLSVADSRLTVKIGNKTYKLVEVK